MTLGFKGQAPFPPARLLLALGATQGAPWCMAAKAMSRRMDHRHRKIRDDGTIETAEVVAMAKSSAGPNSERRIL